MKLKKAIQGINIDILSAGYCPNTLKTYRFYLVKFPEFLGNPEVNDISHEHKMNEDI